MIQFFAPDIATNPVLPESDSQHCIRVLRMGAGDMIQVVDGNGHRLTCRIVDPHPKHALVEIVDSEEVAKPWNFGLTVAVAPTKHIDRMEWLLEKLIEIGIDRFVPLLCRHSERKEIKNERLEKIAVSAMKQSLKTFMPRIDAMTPISAFIKEFANSDCMKFVAYCDADTPRRVLAKEIMPARDCVLLIGPEGDFAPAEIEAAVDAGFIPVTLGDSRLRTETAALAAAQTLHVINQLNS